MGEETDPKDIRLKLPSNFSHGFIRSVVTIVLYAILIALFGYSLLGAADWSTFHIVITAALTIVFCCGLVLELRKLLRQPQWTFSYDGLDIQTSRIGTAPATHYDWTQISGIVYQVELSDKCKSIIEVSFNDPDSETITLNLDEHPGVLGSGLTARKHNHWIAKPLTALCEHHQVKFEMK